MTHRLLATLFLALAAPPAAAQTPIPTVAQLKALVPAAPPVIDRVAFVTTAAARPRGVRPPGDWDAPAEIAVASPLDLDYTLALNDLSDVSTPSQWAGLLARATKADVLVTPAAGGWTLTLPSGQAAQCPARPPTGERTRWAACLGYDGVVVAVQDTWYLVYSYKKSPKRGAQALVLKDSAAALLLTGANVSGDGLVNVVETEGALALVKGITRSSQPVVVGTKLLFESGGPE